MEEIKILTNYIAAWGWQLLSIMFLLTSLTMFALPRTLTTQSFYLGLFLIFVGCQFTSIRRKREVQSGK